MTDVIQSVAAWAAMRGRKTLLYWLGDEPPKYLDDSDVPVLYECLRSMGTTSELDVILCTSGGYLHPARQVALLLREHARTVEVCVPYRARSAGTLMCLAADQIVLGPLGELSPLDPNLRSAQGDPAGAAPLVSSEDVRAYRQMAEDWFGLDAPEHRLRVFELLNQRFFPTALSAFFRAERQMRRMAVELLGYQLANHDPSERGRIVDQLIRGFDAHDHIITRAEAARLGLRVRTTSQEEETRLWTILQACATTLTAPAASTKGPDVRRVNGIILGAHFSARHVIKTAGTSPMVPSAVSYPSDLAGWEVCAR